MLDRDTSIFILLAIVAIGHFLGLPGYIVLPFAFLLFYLYFLWDSKRITSKPIYQDDPHPPTTPWKPSKPTGNMWMSKQEKAAYLSSSKWQLLREVVFARDNHRCVVCGATDILNLHHIHYSNLGEDTTEDVVTLCGGPDGCHTKLHNKLGYSRDGYYPPEALQPDIEDLLEGL